MTFKNEYVPPRDIGSASEFIQRALAESKAKGDIRKFPHPLEHYSAHEHHISAFVIGARDRLRTGHSVWDMWTIDHELEMVLNHGGSGREEAAAETYWNFIDRKGSYSITTIEQSRSSPQPHALVVNYRIKHFWKGNGCSLPDADSLCSFKKALDEYHRYSLFNFDAYLDRHITLIDGRTNTEI